MIKRFWKRKKIYPGKQDICKICGLPKEWELHTAHDRESSLLDSQFYRQLRTRSTLILKGLVVSYRKL